MSPRLREAFRPMLSEDWKPQREVELTSNERQQLLQSFEYLKKNGFFNPPPPPQESPKPRPEVPQVP